MIRNLSVEENLRFCAFTRLPAYWTEHKKLQLVHETLMLLGLWDIRHSQIGDERVRGISGGQRKRVNIGMELAADPTVLFLGRTGECAVTAGPRPDCDSCGWGTLCK